MAFRSAGQPRPPGGRPIVLPRWTRYFLPAAAAVIALIVIVTIAAGVSTDFLWFHSIGYTSVFSTTYGTKWALFIITAVFMAAVIGFNIWLAYRLRPTYRPASPEQQGLEAYRLVIDPHRKLMLGVVLGLIGLVSGLTAAGSWRTWLLFSNRTSFGITDPQFHVDLSFFIFVYPFIRMVLSYLFAAVLLSLLAAVAVHYLYGGLRLQRRGQRATQGARSQLFVLVGIFVLLKAIAYWVDRYGIDFSQRGVVRTGASYTDVNAVLPAKTVLAIIAVICAALFFAGALRRSSMLPAVGFGLLVLSAVLIGGVYPAIIQQFVVKPNEAAKETPYLNREIASTRSAFGLNGVQVSQYSAVSAQTTAQLAKQAAALSDVRLLDQGVVSPSFQQLQQVKGYYKFASVLSVDRYPLAGSSAPVDQVVGVRDMAGPPAARPTGSTVISFTRTVSASSPPPPTRPPRAATRSSPRAISRPLASSAVSSRASTSGSRRRATPSSAAISRNSTTPAVRARAARSTRPTRAAAVSRSARRLTGCSMRSSSARSTSCCPGPSTATQRSCTSGTRSPGWPRSRPS